MFEHNYMVKQKEQDILRDLKSMPYDIPEGYFSSLRENMRPWEQKSAEHSAIRKLSPYLSLAAMFVLIALAGTLLVRKPQSGEEMQLYDYLYYCDLIPVTEPESIYYTEYDESDGGLSEENIIDYLIYTGTSLESIESNR